MNSPTDSATKLAAATLAAGIVTSRGKPVTASAAVLIYKEVLSELSRSDIPLQ